MFNMNNVLIKRGNLDTDIYTRRGLRTQEFIRLAFRIWSGLSNRNCLPLERQRWRAWESDNCSVWEAVCLCSHCLLMQSWRIPAGMMAFSRHWNPDNAGLDTGHSSRADELADEKEGNQGEISLLLPCPLRWAAARRYGSG